MHKARAKTDMVRLALDKGISKAQICRDLEITVTITADGAPPTSQQYYKMCKTESGWRSVN